MICLISKYLISFLGRSTTIEHHRKLYSHSLSAIKHNNSSLEFSVNEEVLIQSTMKYNKANEEPISCKRSEGINNTYLEVTDTRSHLSLKNCSREYFNDKQFIESRNIQIKHYNNPKHMGIAIPYFCFWSFKKKPEEQLFDTKEKDKTEEIEEETINNEQAEKMKLDDPIFIRKKKNTQYNAEKKRNSYFPLRPLNTPYTLIYMIPGLQENYIPTKIKLRNYQIPAILTFIHGYLSEFTYLNMTLLITLFIAGTHLYAKHCSILVGNVLGIELSQDMTNIEVLIVRNWLTEKYCATWEEEYNQRDLKSYVPILKNCDELIAKEELNFKEAVASNKEDTDQYQRKIIDYLLFKKNITELFKSKTIRLKFPIQKCKFSYLNQEKEEKENKDGILEAEFPNGTKMTFFLNVIENVAIKNRDYLEALLRGDEIIVK